MGACETLATTSSEPPRYPDVARSCAHVATCAPHADGAISAVVTTRKTAPGIRRPLYGFNALL